MERVQSISSTDAENTVKIKKQRDINIDLIRCVAIFCLPSIHFLLYSGFYDIPVTGWVMYLMTTIRTISMMCIPLFLLLTGYLMSKKQFSRKYFDGIIRIFLIFILCNIPIYLYRRFVAGELLDLKGFIVQLFSLKEYSWYVSVYIWLFCSIPFLNIVYNGIKLKSGKQALLLVSIAFTVLPSFWNYYSSYMPSVFTSLYPITYYYIGAYIRDYHKDGGKWKMLAFFVISIAACSTINILVSLDKKFLWNMLNDWGSFENTLSATFLFLFLKKLDLSRIPKLVRVIITKVAEWSFGAYLLSWIFDQIFYPKLIEAVPNVIDRMKYYPIMVFSVIICATLLSGIVYGIYNAAVIAAGKIRVRVGQKADNNNDNNISG